MNDRSTEWDVFICHASEDKDAFVRPLAVALHQLGVSVWFDEFSLEIGDSISRSIDKGLAASAYGIVVLSPAFIGKPWPEYELRGLVSREIGEDKVILPIWHGVSRQEVLKFSPPLADKLAIDTSRIGSQDVAIQILRVVRPDLYSRHPRVQLERLASGQAIQDLQSEIERMREELEATREELSEFQCPYCQAPLAERVNAPLDSSQKHWDLSEIYACGYQSFGGQIGSPCPSDPRFPKLEEYELQFHHNPREPRLKWQCLAHPKTINARRLSLSHSLGDTKEEAESGIRDEYKRRSRKYQR
jgi:hypothetical protein